MQRNGHNNLARIVLPSSPLRRIGSTLNLAPSISPTSSSALGPSSGAALCVPPVIRSVFSGTESLGAKFGSTEVRSSGGALSAPTLGISLAIVELVFVMWGPVGLDFCSSRHSEAVSFERGFGKVRGTEVDRGLNASFADRTECERRCRRGIVTN